MLARGARQATAVLLEVDPTLWCVSSWNDNSHAPSFKWNPRRMLRCPPPPPSPHPPRRGGPHVQVPAAIRMRSVGQSSQPPRAFLPHPDAAGCLDTTTGWGRHNCSGRLLAGARRPGDGRPQAPG